MRHLLKNKRHLPKVINDSGLEFRSIDLDSSFPILFVFLLLLFGVAGGRGKRGSATASSSTGACQNS